MEKGKIIEIVKKALNEDIGKGDITTDSIFPENFYISAILICKSNGVLCGVEVFKQVFLCLSPKFSFKFFFKDGDLVKKDTHIAEIYGPCKEILMGERTALNFLQHLSGIATETRKIVEKTEGKVKIYDTRKTTPNLREIEKYAVKIGGGENHRFGLFDMILIKDNHINAFIIKGKIDKISAIKYIIEKAKKYSQGKYKIEIEVENFSQAIAAYESGVDIIMFDNSDIKEILKFCEFLKGKRKVEIEVSGNINLNKIEKIKNLPIDRVSVGYITHSPKSLDFSLKIKEL